MLVTTINDGKNRGLLAKVNIDYLQEDDAYEVNSEIKAWPVSKNPFISRMASTVKPGSMLPVMPVATFEYFVGALTEMNPTRTFTFAAELSQVDGIVHLAAHLLDIHVGEEPPIKADNGGFFTYAMHWFSSRYPAVTLSVTKSALFWVH